MLAVRSTLSRATPMARSFAARSFAVRSYSSEAIKTRLIAKEDISPAQQERIVDVLTDAFLSYPEHTLMWGDSRKINRTLMEGAVAHTIDKHRVWLAESGSDIVGVGLWTDPGAAWFTEEDVPVVFGPVMELLEPELINFMIGDMLPGQYQVEEAYAPGCAEDWYFGAMLAVDPRTQSKGVGGKIMEEIIKRAGDVPIAFHTQGSKNVYFYGKHGFKIAGEHEFVLPNGKTWADKLMVRRPDGSV